MSWNNNDKKSEQLGMATATARAKLRKMLLFDCIQKLGLDVCFACSQKITNIDALSVEHKTPWLNSEDPKGLFWDLDNIAYSHIKCNVPQQNRLISREHGTRTRYRMGCKCSLCKEAERQHSAMRRREKGIPKRNPGKPALNKGSRNHYNRPSKHGTRSKYCNDGCRCSACIETERQYSALRRKHKRILEQ